MKSSTLQFEPWSSCSISNLFWKSLGEKKLNEFQKGRIDIRINGFYMQNSTSKTSTSSLFLSTESFENRSTLTSVSELGPNFITLLGKLVLCDTIEEFKSLDRNAEALKITEYNYLCQQIEDVEYFVLFAFADVKKFKFYHQVAYPVQIFSKEQIICEYTDGNNFKKNDKNNQNSTFPCPFNVNLETNIIEFNDSSNAKEFPGWPLRQLLTKLCYNYPGSKYKIHCCRPIHDSFSLTVQLPSSFSVSGLTGWERASSDPNKMAPVRVTDISGLLDPLQLAKQAGELNLKLMKWRLIPDLDLDCLGRTSCLLVGSGTLGCNILRVLLVFLL